MVQFIQLNGADATRVDPTGQEWPQQASVAFGLGSDGAVVARIGALDLAHFEGLWVREDHRRGTTGPRLMKIAEDMVRRLGRKAILTFVLDSDPALQGYAERLGYAKLPVSVYIKEL